MVHQLSEILDWNYMDLSFIWLRTIGQGWCSPPVNPGERKSVPLFSIIFYSRWCLHQNTSTPQGLSSFTFKAVLTAGKSATIQSNWNGVGMRKFPDVRCIQTVTRFNCFPCGGRSMALFKRKKMRLKGFNNVNLALKRKPSNNFLSSRNVSDVFDFRQADYLLVLSIICWCFYHGKKLQMQKNLRQMPIDTDFVITNLQLTMIISFSNHPFCVEWVLEHVDGAKMLGLKKTHHVTIV